MTKLPRFHEFFNPLLEALRALGGSARTQEAYAAVAEREGLSEEQLALQNKAGVSKFENRVAWARFYLARAGYIDSSRRGVWSLTELGRTSGHLSPAAVAEVCRTVQADSRTIDVPDTTDDSVPDTSVDQAEDTTSFSGAEHRGHLKTLLYDMSASGFERFCQRLLREAGFESVRVTGRSRDGGIDGEGVLQVNPLVSFKVVFQCKRYEKPVGPGHIRDFRGAMTGRADRGLFLTTSGFTRDAEIEAVRDGVSPIELVDADGIIDLIEQLELGVTRVDAFLVDRTFFGEYAD